MDYKPADILTVVQETEDEPAHLMVMQDGVLVRVRLSGGRLLDHLADVAEAVRREYRWKF